jgi:hypothetical protein
MKITKQQLIEMIKEELKQTMEIKYHGYGNPDPWEGELEEPEEEPRRSYTDPPRPKFMLSYKSAEGEKVDLGTAETDEEVMTIMQPYLEKGLSVSVTQNWGKETGGSNEVGYAVPSPASKKRFGV